MTFEGVLRKGALTLGFAVVVGAGSRHGLSAQALEDETAPGEIGYGEVGDG